MPTDIDMEKIGEQIKRQKQLVKQQEDKRKNEARIELAKWLAGESIPHYRFDAINSRAYLRIVGDTVETTLGASVPLEHVRRALPIVLKLIERGEAWRTNGQSIHLGHYKLEAIDADGTVRAGCHTFDASEIKRFASVGDALQPTA